MDSETTRKLRNLAKQARAASSAREFIMYAHSYLLQLHDKPELINEIDKKVNKVSADSDKFLGSAWSGIKRYRNLHESGEPYELLRKLSEEDLPIDEANHNHRINLAKDRQNLTYFHNWVVKRAGLSTSISRKVVASSGDFHVLDDGSVTYQQIAIQLTPQKGRLLRELIKENGRPLSRSRVIDTLWNEAENTDRFLNRDISYQQVNRRISNIVSEINSSLRQYGNNSWHVVSAGETSYKFIP
jgi:DNA-binding winged helix-turn-helix (wHTH) protein